MSRSPHYASETPFYKQHLSDHQVKKFTWLFSHQFDNDQNGMFDKLDTYIWVEKSVCMGLGSGTNLIRAASVFVEHIQAHNRDVKVTYGIVNNAGMSELEVEDELDTIRMEDFLNMWADALNLKDFRLFPQWVQMLPMFYFNAIDRDADYCISKQDLRGFFRDLIQVPETMLDSRTDDAYEAMTENGNFGLYMHTFVHVFESYVMDTEPTGPGRFLFGGLEMP